MSRRLSDPPPLRVRLGAWSGIAAGDRRLRGPSSLELLTGPALMLKHLLDLGLPEQSLSAAAMLIHELDLGAAERRITEQRQQEIA